MEIQWKGHIEKVYYPIPRDGNVRNKVREEMKWGIDRKSKVDKQRDFLVWSQEVILTSANDFLIISLKKLVMA